MKKFIFLFFALSTVLLFLSAPPAYAAIRIHNANVAVATHHTVTNVVPALPQARPDSGWEVLFPFAPQLQVCLPAD